MQAIKRLTAGVLSAVLTLSLAVTSVAATASDIKAWANTAENDYIYRVSSTDPDVNKTAGYDKTDPRMAVITAPKAGGIITVAVFMPDKLKVDALSMAMDFTNLIKAGGSFVKTTQQKYNVNQKDYEWGAVSPGFVGNDKNHPVNLFFGTSGTITLVGDKPIATIDVKVPENLTKDIKVIGSFKNQVALAGSTHPAFDEDNSDYGGRDRVILTIKAPRTYANTPENDYIYSVSSEDPVVNATAGYDKTDSRMAVITAPKAGGIITVAVSMPDKLKVDALSMAMDFTNLINAGGSFVKTTQQKYNVNEEDYEWGTVAPGVIENNENHPTNMFLGTFGPITLVGNKPIATIDVKVPANLTEDITVIGSFKNQVALAGTNVPAFDEEDSDYGGRDRVVLTIKPNDGKPTVSTVAVTPATATVVKGGMQQFTATVTGTNAPAQTVTWDVTGNTSPDTKVDKDGKLVVAANETATALTVIATSTIDTSKSGTAAVTVNESAATVTSVTVSPATATVVKGGMQQFTATVTGTNAPAQTVTWGVTGNTSPDTKVDKDGKLVVAANETATALTVTATSTIDTSKSGTASVTVKEAPATVTSVVVDPPVTSVEKGAKQLFNAIVTGTGSPAKTVTWSVTGNTSADTKIDTTGLLTIDADETATVLTVTASSTVDNTKKGTATVTVLIPAATITAVTVDPANAEVSKGAEKQFAAKVEGTNNPAQAVTWVVTGGSSAATKISATGMLTIGSDETATALTVTATSRVDATKKGTATVTVSAGPAATVTSVTVDPAAITLGKGNQRLFEASVVGTNDPAQGVTWLVTGGSSASTKISTEGVLIVGADETAATLTVKATSDLDATKYGTATVTISTAPVATVTSVTVTPKAATMSRGTEKAFTAVVDGLGGPSESVTWSFVGHNSAATNISPTGMLTIGADETSNALTITATSDLDGSKFDTANVTVEVPPAASVTSVTVTPDTASMEKGTTRQFNAQVVGVGNPVNTVTWKLRGNNSTSTSISATGLLTVGSAETATALTVTATSTADNTKFGTAAVTVKSSGGGGGGGGSTGGGSSASSYTLTFDTNGGSAIPAVRKSIGSTIELSAYTTNRAGYKFEGWYSDAALTTKITNVKLQKDMTIYAKWSQNKDGHLCAAFTDAKGHWAENAICAVVEAKYFNGTSATTFSPDMLLSRGMFVTILYRYAGSPAVTGNAVFGDVVANAFYEKAVVWATQNGIVNGYSNDVFAPNDDISREQMAAIMQRYAKVQKLNSKASGGLETFVDTAQISSWASDSMGWAVSNGLLQGNLSKLSPKANATRAEAATILQRMAAKWG